MVKLSLFFTLLYLYVLLFCAACLVNKDVNNENHANNTAVIRMLAQLNTFYVLTSGLN